MLTKKAKYGVKAMLHLARLDYGQSAFVATIAERNDLPKKFLDAILTDLRNAGLLLSKKGRNGGYTLAKRPEDISMGAIIRALDGPLAPIACASRTSYVPCSDCGPIEQCEIRLMMLDVREAIANVLDHRTLAELRDARGDLMASFVYQI
ncbi:RrF2 family transcriptional regulator [Methylopila henanensis]|uniref:RrF2 family transcriptional regulator n=1 Tax=Methylopila henanensis TaxID=873516 RepID=A0ABW4K4V5_9HYPH